VRVKLPISSPRNAATTHYARYVDLCLQVYGPTFANAQHWCATRLQPSRRHDVRLGIIYQKVKPIGKICRH